jgi:hypothetical protein
MKSLPYLITMVFTSLFWIFILFKMKAQYEVQGTRVFINESSRIQFKAENGDRNASEYIRALKANIENFSYADIREFIQALPE